MTQLVIEKKETYISRIWGSATFFFNVLCIENRATKKHCILKPPAGPGQGPGEVWGKAPENFEILIVFPHANVLNKN